MGEIANDMVQGFCCSDCGVYFEAEHGYPVLCRSCWKQTSPRDRKAEGVQRAHFKEL